MNELAKIKPRNLNKPTATTWLKPWQWVVGILPPFWMGWQILEIVSVFRGKGFLTTSAERRRMAFLQLLSVVMTAAILNVGWSVWTMFALFVWVFFLPGDPKKVKSS